MAPPNGPKAVLLSIRQLADRDGVSVPTISAKVKRLVEKHGLAVERDHLGRVSAVNAAEFDHWLGRYSDPSKAQAQAPERRSIVADGETYDEALRLKTWHEAERTLHATLMGEAADMGLAIAPPAKSVVTDVGGRMVRTTVTARWAYEVLDADAVPREFCAPDPGKINAAVAAGARSIPGVRIYLRDSVSQSPA